MKYHFIAIRWAKSKNVEMARVGEDVHHQNLLYTATANDSVNTYNYLIKQSNIILFLNVTFTLPVIQQCHP